jgi:cytochrome P450
VDESLRLFPPAWSLVREAVEPCTLRGHPISAEGQTWFSPWVVHRDPRWYDAPLAFRPERWANGLAERLPAGAYVPYGSGPRMCVGATLAGAAVPALVATILARVELAAVPGRRPRTFPSINLRPRGGVWANVRGRA